MVHVVAACLLDQNARVLLGKRPRNKKLSGFWEFPGGKLEVGESPEQALSRELKEELNLDLSDFKSLFEHEHRYDFDTVHLHFFSAQLPPNQEPSCMEHEEILFVALEDLASFNLLPADSSILDKIITKLN